MTRTVRMTMLPERALAQARAAAGGRDDPLGAGYSGLPAMLGLGAHYELDVTVTGPAHPVHAYVLDIKVIDRAVQAHVLPILHGAFLAGDTDAFRAVRAAWDALRRALPSMTALRWRLSPYHSLEMQTMPTAHATNDPHIPHATAVLLRHRFDFAASHRLHVDALSERENRELYGKCNNPNGHGHNYQCEPCIALAPRASASGSELLVIQRVVGRVLLDVFDHKHLNIDTPHFDTTRGGVNPSVENIALVFFRLLAPEIAAALPEASLRKITVWESDRTSATFPG